MAQVTISLYGAMRAYDTGAPMIMQISDGANRDELRSAITEFLQITDIELFASCALADENQIIGADYCVSGDLKISILPPVCGG